MVARAVRARQTLHTALRFCLTDGAVSRRAIAVAVQTLDTLVRRAEALVQVGQAAVRIAVALDALLRDAGGMFGIVGATGVVDVAIHALQRRRADVPHWVGRAICTLATLDAALQHHVTNQRGCAVHAGYAFNAAVRARIATAQFAVLVFDALDATLLNGQARGRRRSAIGIVSATKWLLGGATAAG
jgi:hypothetical protein